LKEDPMRHISTATIIVVVLAATAGGAGAQAPTPTGVPDYQAAINALRDSQWVRLAVPDNGRREGQLLERSSELVVLSAEPQPLRATTIDTLWTRGSAVKTGAFVGALTGLALGVGLGLVGGGGEEFSTGLVAVALGGFGLGAGAVLGTVIGLAIPKWHRQYP
jgi:hypothetical protein